MKPVPHFDMAADPVRTRWYLRPLTWLLSKPVAMAHKTRITRIGMEGIKPPYLLLRNHNSFMDFQILTTAIYPERANYVVAIDGFVGRKWIMLKVGCICKRKFTQDLRLIRNLKKIVDNGDIAVVYPEARYSLCGTTAVLPASLGKLCKMLKVPVVVIRCHGHHVNSPFWNLRDRKIKPTEAELELIYDVPALEKASVDEVNDRLVQAFQYDDWTWLKERGLRLPMPWRAEGLHKVLYQCPHCGTEYEMDSKGTEIFCKHCGKRWHMTELGELQAVEGETEFSHVPDWYEWERAQVRAEVEAGTYDSGKLRITIHSLPDAKYYTYTGGTFRHNMDGFVARVKHPDGTVEELRRTVPEMYSVHVEYEFLGKWGDCVELSTLEESWICHPESGPYSVTKIALATEELYYAWRRSIGKPCKPGLA